MTDKTTKVPIDDTSRAQGKAFAYCKHPSLTNYYSY